MRVSAERLAADAVATGFRPDMLEKAIHLLGLLDVMQSHPSLKGKLALKGGTALNLFAFDVPRLSVDIDLNYVGSDSREAMLAVFSREDFNVRRMPQGHAGGKWSLRYAAASGQSGRIDVDVNYMYRVPLWRIAMMDSRRLGSWQVSDIPVVDIHELAAGKLTALLDRRKARDVFDSCLIFSIDELELASLRTAFVVYGAMARKDWRTVSIEDVSFDSSELSSQLVPSLRLDANPGLEATSYGKTLVEECRKALSNLLPFEGPELAFLDLLLDRGEVDATLLTSDEALQERIQAQPLLKWKAQHVRRHNK